MLVPLSKNAKAKVMRNSHSLILDWIKSVNERLVLLLKEELEILNNGMVDVGWIQKEANIDEFQNSIIKMENIQVKK